MSESSQEKGEHLAGKSPVILYEGIPDSDEWWSLDRAKGEFVYSSRPSNTFVEIRGSGNKFSVRIGKGAKNDSGVYEAKISENPNSKRDINPLRAEVFSDDLTSFDPIGWYQLQKVLGVQLSAGTYPEARKNLQEIIKEYLSAKPDREILNNLLGGFPFSDVLDKVNKEIPENLEQILGILKTRGIPVDKMATEKRLAEAGASLDMREIQMPDTSPRELLRSISPVTQISGNIEPTSFGHRMRGSLAAFLVKAGRFLGHRDPQKPASPAQGHSVRGGNPK